MPSGTIAYCSREDHSSPLFPAFLAKLAQRHPDAVILPVITNDIADGRNHAVLQAQGDWIFFIDTDMAFAAETLERLIAHDVDVVQVLCLRRHPPHAPILWEDAPDRQNAAPRGSPRLVEVQSLGAGGTLYRKRVFEAMVGPWFEGILGVEDTNFAKKITASGFRLHVDMATPVGHTTPMVVWPQYNAVTGQWGVRYDAMNGQHTLISYAESTLIVRPELVRAVAP